ncbi:MAG TPA: mannitol dehydrogenase family protein [Caulobacteraceae bacterium]|nr:mannitol dehydrogenase family protein [Caulobacteraceae bacterium]
MSARLCEAALAGLPAEVERPRYDRRKVRAGVVHLGLGAFHRAHQAYVFHELLQTGHLDWGVTAACIHSPKVRDQLAPQDGLYCLLEREGEMRRARVCGAIGHVLVAAEAPQRLAAAIADPAVALVTLTITEKGYDDAKGPIWAVLAAGLERRRALGAPLTILSCDNLADNGRLARQAVLGAAGASALAAWIGRACAFPSSMVDRITPATLAVDRDEAAGRLGVRDEACVVAEPFWQWVVENRFAARAPPLEQAGVELVSDVAPWERAKLRLLNAAHSALAYAGLLCGFVHVHEAIAWPPLRDLVERLWDEAAETLGPVPGLDVRRYRADLMRRLRNPSLQHRLDQIAADGSGKLPPRLLASLAERQDRGLTSPALGFALACWIRCLDGVDDRGGEIRLSDPLLARLQAWRHEGTDGISLMVQAGMIAPGSSIAASPELLARQLAALRIAGARTGLAGLGRLQWR